MIMQRGGEAIQIRRHLRAHLAHHVDGVDAGRGRQGQHVFGHLEGGGLDFPGKK